MTQRVKIRRDPDKERRAVRSYLVECYAQWMELRERPPSMQWAAENISLPSSISPQKPGRYEPNAYPMATVLYEFFDNPLYEEFIGVKSSQSGFSQAAWNIACQIVEFQLGNIIVAMDSRDNAIAKGEEILLPMLKEACRAVARYIPDNSKRLKKEVLNLLGVRINLVGAKSAGKLASRTVPFIIGDEVDEWPTELAGGESNALDLLRDRCKLLAGTGRKKLMVFSKPRNALTPEKAEEHAARRHKKAKEDGIIWQEAQTGTRHRCHVPCPQCGVYDWLRWEQMRFNHCRTLENDAWDYQRLLSDVFYECPHCKGQLRESDFVDGVPLKEWLIARKQWRATNHGQDNEKPVPGKMSALTDDLLATDPGSTWGHLATECVNAKTTSQKRKFRRSRLGLPVQEAVIARARVRDLLHLAGHHGRGTAPDCVVAACLMVDVQEHGELFRWQQVGFDMEGNAYVINHGETPLSAELARVLNSEIPTVNKSGLLTGGKMRAPMGWIDEGDGQSKTKILDLCVEPAFYRRLSTVRGRGGQQTESMVDRVTLQQTRVHKGKPLDRYMVDHDYFMDQLYEDRISPWADYYRALGEGKTPDMPNGLRVYWPRDPLPEVLEEYTTEKKDWHMRGGKMVFGWLEKPQGGKNDHSDMTKYALAWWYRVRPMIEKAMKKQAAAANDPGGKVDNAAG